MFVCLIMCVGVSFIVRAGWCPLHTGILIHFLTLMFYIKCVCLSDYVSVFLSMCELGGARCTME